MEIKYVLKKGSGIKISVLIGKEEVGHAYLYLLYNSLHKEPFGFIEDVYVNEKYRGKGVGKKIVLELIKKAKENKCYKLIGTSRYSRRKVHKFYENFGFKDYGKEFRINL
jgi:GNAT superfamily N-acetyltransferase